MKVLFLLAAAVPALAQTCTFTPQFSSFTLGSAAFSSLLPVATQPGCPWTASANVPWIHITNQQTYVGTQSVGYQIDANTTTQIRNGAITVGNQSTQQTVTYTQIAGDCNYQISPSAPVNYPVSGGSGGFQVTAGCNWYASAGASWITVTAPTTTILGNGSVTYTAAANACVASRSGTVNIVTGAQVPPPPTLTITQDGSQANLTLVSTSATFPPAAGAGKVTVNTGDGCSWSGFSDATWLQITGNSGAGSGTGAVTFSIAQNTGPQRVGHIYVGTQVYTVTQTGIGPAAPVLTAIINAASGASGPISPGEIVSVFGSNLGPAVGVPFGQTIPFSLAQVQVMFGNSPAPLTYVSATQINAVVPYEVAGATTVPVVVQYSGQPSSPLSATVQAATPAIFSADFSGHGPGAILNSDFSVNGGSNPASVGSAVMIYGTGGGVTSPASADGSLAPSAEPFARIVASPVSVTIGGLPAQVLYAGGSPGLVSGLTQINAIVPNGVAAGLSVPVIVQIGSVQSQQGVTIAIGH
jgi:uncharacterized protein (TIGR03437 family)